MFNKILLSFDYLWYVDRLYLQRFDTLFGMLRNVAAASYPREMFGRHGQMHSDH